MPQRNRPTTGDREVRRWGVQNVEVRDAGGDTVTLTGRASVVDAAYDMYGGPPYGWREIVARGAFDKTLSERPDVQLLVNHEGLPLARTKSGTLALAATPDLEVEAELLRGDPDVARLLPKMERGDIDEMSFAFRVVRQRWEDDQGNEVDWYVATVRRILEVNIHKGDVSVVNYGANPATSAQIRSLTEQLESLGAVRLDEDLVDQVRAAGPAPLAAIPTIRALLDEIEARATGRSSDAEEWRQQLAAQKATLGIV